MLAKPEFIAVFYSTSVSHSFLEVAEQRCRREFIAACKFESSYVPFPQVVSK